MWRFRWMETANRQPFPHGWIKSHSHTGKLAAESARDFRVPGFYLLSARRLLGVRLTLTQYSGLGGGVNAAFASLGRRHASLAVSGTRSICFTDPLLLTWMISSVGAGPLATVLHS